MERIIGEWGENIFTLLARAARLQCRAEIIFNGEVIEVPADLPWLAAVQWVHDALVRPIGQIGREAQELRAEVAALKAEVKSLRERQ